MNTLQKAHQEYLKTHRFVEYEKWVATEHGQKAIMELQHKIRRLLGGGGVYERHSI